MEKEYKYMVCTRCMTYNHAPYIVDAMNGFTMQETTFPVYYLITDDASTDGEPEVIKQYLADHFQSPYRTEDTDDYYLICAVHKTNPNCNFIVFFLKYNHYSIKKSKLPYQAEWRDNAKYIALCEGDDYWIHPEKLQKQVSILEANSNIGLCYTDSDIIHQESGSLRKSKDKRTFSVTEDLFIHNPIFTLTTLYRAELYKKYYNEIQPNTYNWKIGDLPIWIWFSIHSEIYFLNEVTSVYRILKNSASHNERLEPRRDFIMSVYDVHSFFIKHYFPNNEKLKRRVENRKNRRLAYLYASHKDYGQFLKYYMNVSPKTLKDWLNIILIKCHLYRIYHYIH